MEAPAMTAVPFGLLFAFALPFYFLSRATDTALNSELFFAGQSFRLGYDFLARPST
jgi:hypothetical protein